MKKIIGKDYSKIIAGLKKLNYVKPSRRFEEHVQNFLIPSLARYESSRKQVSPLFALRLIVSILLFTFLGGTGLVLAASQSQPGDLLYGLKKVVEQVNLMPVDNSDQLKMGTPTPQTNSQESPNTGANETEKKSSDFSNQTPLPTATANPLNKIPQKIEGVLPSGTPTPTPTPLLTVPPLINQQNDLLKLDINLGEKKLLNIGL